MPPPSNQGENVRQRQVSSCYRESSHILLHQILFRVGEIVFHRDYEVRGVVLGWDREAKAPLSWLRQAGHGCDYLFIFPSPDLRSQKKAILSMI